MEANPLHQPNLFTLGHMPLVFNVTSFTILFLSVSYYYSIAFINEPFDKLHQSLLSHSILEEALLIGVHPLYCISQPVLRAW